MPDAQTTNKLSPRELPRVPSSHDVVLGIPGFQHWTLRCRRCGIIHGAQAPSDPINAEALG